jgi:hypothetical protein
VGIILCTEHNETVAKLTLQRVYAPIAVSTWQVGTPAPELPPAEVTIGYSSAIKNLEEEGRVAAIGARHGR